MPVEVQMQGGRRQALRTNSGSPPEIHRVRGGGGVVVVVWGGKGVGTVEVPTIVEVETWKLEKGGRNSIKWLERKRPAVVFSRFFAYNVSAYNGSEEATEYSHCERRENGPQLENCIIASRLGLRRERYYAIVGDPLSLGRDKHDTLISVRYVLYCTCYVQHSTYCTLIWVWMGSYLGFIVYPFIGVKLRAQRGPQITHFSNCRLVYQSPFEG
jgi:hypothetical protein